MSSTAARKRKRTQRQYARLEPKKARKTPASLVAHTNPNPPARYHERTGLEWLAHKGKISAAQHKAGRRYGQDFRVVDVNGLVPLTSCLDDTPRGSTGRAGPCMAVFDLLAQDRLEAARLALAYHEDMIDVCDAICGRDRTPWEIARGVQKEADKCLQTLRIALDLLSCHYGAG